MATRKKQIAELKAKDEPTVVKGSHLTVITHPDGKTELLWDDEALLNEVRAAILTAESTIPSSETKPKRTRKAKE
jgi:hypothetical protein